MPWQQRPTLSCFQSDVDPFGFHSLHPASGFPSVLGCMLSFFVSHRNTFYSFFRISRLFSDAKKILLYSRNDKNLEGFKELSRALHVLQSSRSGRNAELRASWSCWTCLRGSEGGGHSKNCTVEKTKVCLTVKLQLR